SEWMDVFLCAQCRFFIGVASGLSQVAVSFGVPCVYTNWVSNVLPPFSAKDIFIPKLFRWGDDRRLLPFGATLDPYFADLNFNYYLLLKRGISVVNNTPAELADVVQEMLDQLDGTDTHSGEDTELQEQFSQIAQAYGYKGYCRMGKAFLR